MEANEAMKAMAKRIAWEAVLVVHATTRKNMEAAALAAIIETQEACARLADEIAIVGILNASETGWAVADKIRAGKHYALAGERHANQQ